MLDTIQNSRIGSLFQSVVEQNGNAVALKDLKNQLTFEMLAKEIDEFRRTHELNVSDSLHFGLLMEPSVEYIIAFMSLLAAGHTVVPINSDLPKNRIEQIVAATSFDGLFTLDSIETDFDIPNSVPIQSLLFQNSHLIATSRNKGERISSTYDTKKNSAYTIFTSGTTGNPKGICGTEEGLVHFIQWEIDTFQLKGLNVGMLTNIGFDVSFRDILVPLLSGGTICIPGRNGVKNPIELLNWIKDQKIELIHSVPSILRLFSQNSEHEQFESLKYIFSAGEALYWEDVILLKKIAKNAQLVNLYGPSETTLAKIYFKIPSNESVNKGIVPLGNPLDAEVSVLVANDWDDEVEDGTEAELIIQTKYASQGYLNDAELNAAKFRIIQDENGESVTQFKTGDIGVKIDGVFHYRGRIDHQCKIEGNRVELLGVEAVLRELGMVDNCAVVLDSRTEKVNEIIAFVVAKSDHTSDSILMALRDKLASYAVPKRICFVDSIPLNQNGKVDREALLNSLSKTDNVFTEETVKSQSPTNALQEELKSIISTILRRDEFPMDKSFIELGGSSLNAIQLIAAVYKAHKVLLEVPFILGNSVQKVITFVSNSLSPTDAIEVEEDLESSFDLSPFQEQLLYMSNFSNDANVAYNVFESYKVNEVLDIAKLKAAIIDTVEGHDIFRTNYSIDGDTSKQHVMPMDEEQLIHVKENCSEEEIKENFDGIASTPFDLENDKLLIQFYIYSSGENTFHLAFKVHHIAVDAWALQNLRIQIIDRYLGVEVEKISATQYQAFVSTYKEYMQSERFKLDKRYWLDKFKKKSEFQSPTEFARPTTLGFKGKVEQISLDSELSQNFIDLAKELNMTTFMLFSSIVSIPLSAYSESSEVLLGTPVSLRDLRGDLNNSMGYFLNMLPIRICVDNQSSVQQYLKKVANSMLEDYNHKLYPFQQLVNELEYGFQANRNPLFDIMIVELDYVASADDSGENTTVTLENTNDFSSKFDLTLGLIKRGKDLGISLEYNIDLYSQQAAKDILADVLKTIKEASNNQNQAIHEITFERTFTSSELELNKEDNTSHLSEETLEINEEVERFVAQTLNGLIATYNPENNFFEEGLTSAQSLLLITRINKEFGVKIKIIDLWKYHYQKDLVAFVSSQLIHQKI